uniref:3'-5' exonuclease domain-containing protein n=1 Tax=Caenorhabditis tropicalis TaxID=1561998 RepID=A0A1I7USE3_9PELO
MSQQTRVPAGVVHRHISGLIADKLAKKEMSPGAITDCIIYGAKYGPYHNSIGNRIWNTVSPHLTKLHGGIQRDLRTVLVEGRQRNDLLDQLSQARYNPSLYPPTIYHNLTKYRIKEVNDINDVLYFLRKFRREKAEHPLYLDTERVLLPDKCGVEMTALIQLFDIYSSTILLIRTHRDSEFVRTIGRHLRDFSQTRKIAAFGSETILEEARTIDMQPNNQMSLKRYADVYGFTVSKSETTSDWENKKYRADQIKYAAYDVVVLHLIRMRILEDGERIAKDYEKHNVDI